MKFVIIRQDFDLDQSTFLPFVITTIYDNLDTLEYVEKWLSHYMNEEIKSLLYTPPREHELLVHYEIEEDKSGKIFSLIKKYRKLEKGYIYNKYSDVNEKLFDIKVIEDNQLSSNLSAINLIDGKDNLINDEVNQRVIKTLERESLQIFLNDMRNSIKSKKLWNTDELLYLESQVLRQLKKKLTNKIKRTVTREFSEYKNDTNIEDENLTFKAEYTVLNKYGKLD